MRDTEVEGNSLSLRQSLTHCFGKKRRNEVLQKALTSLNDNAVVQTSYFSK